MNKWKRGEGKQTGWRRAETKKDEEDEEKHFPPRGGGGGSLRVSSIIDNSPQKPCAHFP